MPALDDTLLMALADGELDVATASVVAAAIAHDPDAQDKVLRFRRSADLVRAVFDQPHLRQEMPARREMPPPRRSRPPSWPQHSLIAASLALFLLGMGAGAGIILIKPAPSFSEKLLDEVADYHGLYAHESEHQVEVSAARLTHIEAWLGNRLHRQLVVPDLAAHGLTFVGARLLSVDGTAVAQLLYQAPGREHEPIALCIAQDKTPDAGVRGEKNAGLQEVTWSRSSYSYVLAGWETRAFLASLASELAPTLDATS